MERNVFIARGSLRSSDKRAHSFGRGVMKVCSNGFRVSRQHVGGTSRIPAPALVCRWWGGGGFVNGLEVNRSAVARSLTASSTSVATEPFSPPSL